MSPLPSSLLSAARSGEIRGCTLAVYIELHEWLDSETYKTVPMWRVAELISVDEAQVYRALAVLEQRGYLKQGARLGNARTFRIIERADRAA